MVLGSSPVAVTCIIIVYVIGVICFCSHLLEVICRNRQRHKNLIKVLNKKHASREVFSFKNFIKKNVNIHKTEITCSDIGKVNRELTKCDIWYFLRMLLINSFTLNLFQYKQTSTSSKRFCTSNRLFPSVFYLNGP